MLHIKGGYEWPLPIWADPCVYWNVIGSAAQSDRYFSEKKEKRKKASKEEAKMVKIKEKELSGAEKRRAKKKKKLIEDAAKCAKLTDVFRGGGSQAGHNTGLNSTAASAATATAGKLTLALPTVHGAIISDWTTLIRYIPKRTFFWVAKVASQPHEHTDFTHINWDIFKRIKKKLRYKNIKVVNNNGPHLCFAPVKIQSPPIGELEDMQNNNRAPTALIMKEYSHIKCQIKQQKLGFGFV